MSQYSQSIALSAAPAQSIALSAPAQSIVYSAPAQSIALSAQAQSIAIAASPALSIAAAPVAVVADNRWAEYSPEEVVLPEPALPEPDYRCYAPPQVPPGQTRYLQVNEPTAVKNLAQNFDDLRTAVRENNTHVQRNKTLVTNIARNHNHLLRIITNENNFEHNLTNNLVRVADIHRQKIENIKGETRNFKDFKATQKVEAAGCSRADGIQVVSAPADNCARSPALSVAQSAPARSIALSAQAQSIAQSAAPGRISVLAPATTNPVQYIQSEVSLSQGPAQSLRSSRLA